MGFQLLDCLGGCVPTKKLGVWLIGIVSFIGWTFVGKAIIRLESVDKFDTVLTIVLLIPCSFFSLVGTYVLLTSIWQVVFSF